MGELGEDGKEKGFLVEREGWRKRCEGGGRGRGGSGREAEEEAGGGGGGGGGGEGRDNSGLDGEGGILGILVKGEEASEVVSRLWRRKGSIAKVWGHGYTGQEGECGIMWGGGGLQECCDVDGSYTIIRII